MHQSSHVFGQLFREAIKNRGITEEAFADQIDVAKSTLSAWISGSRSFPVGRIDGVVLALDLKGKRRERFEIEALLTKAPERLVHWVRRQQGWK